MKKLALLVAAIGTAFGANAAGTSVEFGGTIKLDVLATQYQDGEAPESNIKEYASPVSIPIGGDNSQIGLDFTAKQSRFHFKTNTTFSNGDQLASYFEMDFLTDSGDEEYSNSYEPRLRHAYFTYNNVLAGQTWTTLMNVDALPDTVDYLGATEGTIYARQAQVRFNFGNFNVALENSQTDVTNAVGVTIEDDNGSVPDIVTRYDFASGENSFSVGAVLRYLNYDVQTSAINEDKLAGGFNIAGKLKFYDDNLSFSYSYGALGRYLGEGLISDAYVNDRGTLSSINIKAGYVAYKHQWDTSLRSSLIAGYWSAHSDEQAILAGQNREVSSLRANLIWEPHPGVTFGAEVSHAKREVSTGEKGYVDRAQFSAKYSF